MDKLVHFSDCATMVTRLEVADSPSKRGVVFTVVDQITNKELRACMSRSSLLKLISFLEKRSKDGRQTETN